MVLRLTDGEEDGLCDSQKSLLRCLESQYPRVTVGNQFASEASLGGGEARILVIAVLPFRMM